MNQMRKSRNSDMKDFEEEVRAWVESRPDTSWRLIATLAIAAVSANLVLAFVIVALIALWLPDAF